MMTSRSDLPRKSVSLYLKPAETRAFLSRTYLSYSTDGSASNRKLILRYAFDMKTVVSIPDKIFEDAERLARRMKKSRSEIYSRALSEYVSHHSRNETTLAMNAALEDIGGAPDIFVNAAASNIFERTEW